MKIRFAKILPLFVLLLCLGLGSCNLPPRSPIPNDHVRQYHKIGGTVYRGRPWWKRNQNLRVGQEYKPLESNLPKNPKPKVKKRKQTQRRKFLWWWIKWPFDR